MGAKPESASSRTGWETAAKHDPVRRRGALWSPGDKEPLRCLHQVVCGQAPTHLSRLPSHLPATLIYVQLMHLIPLTPRLCTHSASSRKHSSRELTFLSVRLDCLKVVSPSLLFPSVNFLLSASVTSPMKWGCGSQTLQDMNSAWPTVGTEKYFYQSIYIV